MTAGFTALLIGNNAAGSAAAVLEDSGSAPVFDDAKAANFGVGASGLLDVASAVRSGAVKVAAAGEAGVAGVRGASAGIALQQNKTSAVRIKRPPQSCRAEERVPG